MFVVSVFTALLVSPATAGAYAKLGISTPSFSFSVAPGGAGKGDLVISNDGTVPIKVMVYASNQTVDAKGKVSYDVPNRDTQNITNNPAMWLSISLPATATKSYGNVPYVEMKPGEHLPVQFEFLTPADAPAGDHQALIFFEMFDFAKNQPGAVSMIRGRLGSKMRIRVLGDIKENLDVRPFSMRSFVIGDRVPYDFVIRNLGNIDALMTAKMSYFDSNENESNASIPMSETTVFASSEKEVSGTQQLQDTWLGMYKVRLDVTYPRDALGGKSQQQHIIKERTVWVVPLWLVVIVVVLVGFLVLWAMWRRALSSARRMAQQDRGGQSESN